MKYEFRPLTEHEQQRSFATHPRKVMSPTGGPCCDFCGEFPPVVVYAADRMVTGEWQQCWRWCACMTCQELILEERYDELMRRTMACTRAMFAVLPAQEPALELVVQVLYEDFKAHAIPQVGTP